MSKERLEEIEERVLVDKVYYKYLDGTQGHWGKVYTLSEEDYNYLKEQAERAKELENHNKRYREAIEKALDESGWGDEGYALYKIIDILNKVLEGDDD